MAAGAPIVCSRHPRLQGRRPARRAGAARPAARPQGARRRDRPAPRRPGPAAAMAPAGRARAAEFSWERVTAKVEDYYGFVIRRLAATGSPAARLPRRDPGAARPRAPSTARPTRPARSSRAPAPLGPPGVAAASSASRRRPGRRSPVDQSRQPITTLMATTAGESATLARIARCTEDRDRARRRSPAAIGVHRELERVEVGRQDALVGVEDRRRAAAAPRCSGRG